MDYIFQSVPYNNHHIRSMLESGITSFIIEEEYCDVVRAMANITVYPYEHIHYIEIQTKDDEILATNLLKQGKYVIIQSDCQVIPLENIIAQTEHVWLAIQSYEQLTLASQILEHGVHAVVFTYEHHDILTYRHSIEQELYQLSSASITAIKHIPLGDRACIDTISLCKQGQGILVGNSSAFLFLVHAETEYNEYVASRPFRINAGSIHSYTMLPNDRTCYLSELQSGSPILLCSSTGECTPTIVGRVKIEKRPLLLITAEYNGVQGSIFLQNAETIALVTEDGYPKSVSTLSIGDRILVHLDSAGRHFGMRVQESIQE